MSPLAVLLFVVLSTIAVGGVTYAILQPKIANNKRVTERKTVYSRDEAARARAGQVRDRLQEQAKRRKTLQNNLKDMENRVRERGFKGQKLSLEQTLKQCGLKISARSFRLVSAAAGFVTGFVVLLFGIPLLFAIGIGIVAGLGLPRVFLARRKAARIKAFSNHFPTAIDLIVRGVKAGLPLNDTLRTVVSDVPEPVAGEFRKIIEAQQVGVPLGEACERLYNQIPLPETNFFAIVITIQAQAGGNLSEALGNLSRVLRDRRRMRQKIDAVSMEAKASATIIGAIPVCVALMIHFTAPDYLSALFHDARGNIILLGCGLWMATGILVMRRMINFDV
ncbi:pilus assembly protein [Fulvimarina endophytica]|uniref:Pilus assembly protein n=1 Tax=Fulvimarina endophytica TaxID=2293836 RepID=A0A371X6Y9_9HYPH|nr:type II secretion system F family protein [Fulvimarina endophytica]RFC64988.1 pilus assembly protein [Fulvimarina endophytica]